MSELGDFRSTTLTRFVAAEEALHNGDPEPRLAMWSDQDPVTLFGAWGPCKSGWKEVSPVFRWLASRFSGVSDYRLDLVAAGTVGPGSPNWGRCGSGRRSLVAGQHGGTAGSADSQAPLGFSELASGPRGFTDDLERLRVKPVAIARPVAGG
jgi:hypothetical protein